MRNIQTHDVFVALQIANSAGVKDEVQKMASRVANGEKISVQKAGIEFMFNVLGNCADEKTENLIYKFIGGILEEDPAELRVMNPLLLIEKIKGLKEVISVEDWKDFFHSLSAVIQMQNF